jgi:ATP-binding cassette, subfamily F, member 2
MAPSVSKQKRLAEKAAKQAAKGNGPASSKSTPAGSIDGMSTSHTPQSNVSAAASTDDLSAMAKLQLETDRYVPRFPQNGCV